MLTAYAQHGLVPVVNAIFVKGRKSVKDPMRLTGPRASSIVVLGNALLRCNYSE